MAILGQRIAILGATPEAARLVGLLRREGFGDALVGVFDHRLDQRRGQSGMAMKDVLDYEFDPLVVTDDRDKEALLEAFRLLDDRLPEVLIYGTAHFDFRDATFEELLHSSVGVSLANGYAHSLAHLYECVQHAAAHRLQGHVAEFGVLKGGRSLLLAMFAEHFGLEETRVYGFDTFGGFPPRRSVLDLYARPGCVFTDFEVVQRLCASHPRIELIRGDIVETH